jgi:DNA primase
VELEVGDRTVRISNPDRVYFPGRGETKLDLANYYLTGLRPSPTSRVVVGWGGWAPIGG